MIERKFVCQGLSYKVELDRYTYRVYSLEKMSIWDGGLFLAAIGEQPTEYRRCYEPSREVVRAALDTLAADPYQRLRRTHAAALDRMIEALANKSLSWQVLLSAKQKLGLL